MFLLLGLLAACAKPPAKPASPPPVADDDSNASSDAEDGMASLNALLDALDTNGRWQGSLVLARDGEVRFSRAIGERTPGGEAVDADTRLRIGSVSKVFTSVLVHQLAAEGALSLDAPLATWFPDLPNADRITIEQLLDHHSGLFNFTDGDDYPEWMEAPATREKLLAAMSVDPEFEPGERAGYSNSNYVLLGWIVEEVTGTSYADALVERIAKPAGLTRTMLGDGIDPDDNEARSQQYTADGWVVDTETDPSIPGGAGAIVSTPTDLCRFAEALFTGDLLDADGLASMKTLDDDIGRGLFTFPYYDRTAWGHTGGIDGFSSMLGWFEDDASCIAIVTFGNNLVDRDTNSLAIDALGALNGRPVENLTVRPPVAIDLEALKAYEGVYASDAIPLDMTLKIDGSSLTGQGTGQAAFPLSPVDQTTFVFAPAGVTIVLGEPGRFTLEQGGGTFEFTRKDAE
jgi:D-alanyl-D-alanine carboxypeptidase